MDDGPNVEPNIEGETGWNNEGLLNKLHFKENYIDYQRIPGTIYRRPLRMIKYFILEQYQPSGFLL